MKYSLRTKISASFFSMSMILFLLIIISANYLLQSGFQEYTISKVKEESKGMVSQLTKKYSTASGKWDMAGIESIGTNAMERGLIVKVVDDKNKVIWDARVYNNGYCSNMLANMQMNMKEHNPDFMGGYEEKYYSLTDGSDDIGKLYIGYYGPYYYDDSDMKYLNTLKQLLMGAGVLALALSLALGSYIAKRLSQPIGKVIKAAKKISSGDFGTKLIDASNTKEIIELTDTINGLGETLNRQESLRKRLSSDIAHDLRTPIATLQSHIEMMMEGIWEADAKRLKSCYDETVRLGNMVGDLAKIAQLEGENLIVRNDEIDLNQIGRSVVKIVESDFYKKNVAISYDGQESKTRGDSDKLKQVFINLISNALNYTQAGGKVHVHVTKSEDMIIIKVNDNGIGIPDEDLPYIFERFYRVDKSRNRNTGGTGIGLAISKALVEAHGGRIYAHSIEGQGSTFIFELPIIK